VPLRTAEGARWRKVNGVLLDTSAEALRCLGRRPAFTVFAVVVLALGVAAVASAFAVVNGILLRPLPYGNPGRLVLVPNGVRPADYYDIRAGVAAFSATALAARGQATVGGPSVARSAVTMRVSPRFFSVLGFRPDPSRAFAREDYAPRGPRVAIISDRLRHALFPPEERVVGKSILLGSQLFTVVAVAPPRLTFRLYWPDKAVDVWLPLALTPRERGARGVPGRSFSGPRPGSFPYFTFFIARLRPGVSRHHAQDELDRVVRNLIARHPEDAGLLGLRLWTMMRTRVRTAGQALWPLLGMAFVFLVIAGANLLGLSLARWLGRRREMSTRAALGAGPARLTALAAAEGCWIGAAGGALGALWSYWGVGLFRISAPASMLPRLSGVVLDGRDVGLAFIAALAVSVVATALPALLWRGAPAACLRSASPGAVRPMQQRWLGPAVIVVQSAIAVVLLGLAGEMLTGIWRLSRAPLGFQPDHVIEAQLSRRTSGHRAWNRGQNARLWRRVLIGASALPGVRSAALANVPYGMYPQCRFRFPTPGQAGGEMAQWYNVSPGYFRTLRVRVLAGRGFSLRDGPGTNPTVVVNRAFQRVYLSHAPLGRPVDIQFTWPSGKWRRFRVVGVVADNHIGGTWEPGDAPQLFTSDLQFPSPAAFLMARTRAGIYPSMKSFAHAAATLGSGHPLLVRGVRPLRGDIRGLLRLPRLLGAIVTIFAGLALVLVFAGIFGISTLNASLKTRELGIRRALGATRVRLAAGALAGAAALASGGAAAGFIAAHELNSTVRGWLFGFQPAATAAIAAAAVAIAAACLTGALLPTLRALRSEPAQVLRLD
jgi:putative ABC transport system permease protein